MENGICGHIWSLDHPKMCSIHFWLQKKNDLSIGNLTWPWEMLYKFRLDIIGKRLWIETFRCHVWSREGTLSCLLILWVQWVPCSGKVHHTSTNWFLPSSSGSRHFPDYDVMALLQRWNLETYRMWLDGLFCQRVECVELAVSIFIKMMACQCR
jgi:hypothetical protein